MRTDKAIPLEALRGGAALAVVLCHSMMAFFSSGQGAPPLFYAASAFPFFAIFNGGAAVCFFFTLSGFVLVRKYLVSGDEALIYRGALKRWPRLVFPVLLSALASWILFTLSLYSHEEAGQRLGLTWLETFGGANPAPRAPSLESALYQAFIGVFIGTGAQINTVLWTMSYELIGSYIVFGMALFLRASKDQPAYLKIIPLAITAIFLCRTTPYYFCFVVGVAIAAFLPVNRMKGRSFSFVILAIIAFYLLGYTPRAGGIYASVSSVLGSDAGQMIIYLYAVASAGLIWAVERSSILDSALSGRTAAFLGALSFPIYLVHFLVLCSVGCGVYLYLADAGFGAYANGIAVLVTVAVSVVAALPFIVADTWWIRKINHVSAAATVRRPRSSDRNTVAAQ